MVYDFNSAALGGSVGLVVATVVFIVILTLAKGL